MDALLRGFAIYFFLLLVFRITGQRSLGQVTTFDFVLLLIISETTQQALLGEDFSITNAGLLITTLVTLDIALAFLKRRWPALDRMLEGMPVVVVEDGKPLEHRLRRAGIDREDVLSAAREHQGLHRMEEIRWAVLERNGSISIVPKRASNG